MYYLLTLCTAYYVISAPALDGNSYFDPRHVTWAVHVRVHVHLTASKAPDAASVTMSDHLGPSPSRSPQPLTPTRADS